MIRARVLHWLILSILTIPHVPFVGADDGPVRLVTTLEGDTVVGVPDEILLGDRSPEVIRLSYFAPPGLATLTITLTWRTHVETQVAGANDFDLYVFHEGLPIGAAASASMPEVLRLNAPPSGQYRLDLHPFATTPEHWTVIIEGILATQTPPPPMPHDVNRDSFVVVAIVDTGVNPYHDAFSSELYPLNRDGNPANDVDFTVHPARYVTGYPQSSTRLDLSLDATSYSAAKTADLAKFKAIPKGSLHWIPGTKIIGVIDGGESLGTDTTPILDDHGHGTATASLAAGNNLPLSFCPECLIVVVEGAEGLSWATRQPWIDFVSNSWGTLGNLGAPGYLFGNDHEFTRGAAERGQTVLFASGNGFENFFLTPEPTYESNYAGPGWNVRVGAVVTGNEQSIFGSGHPVDIASYGAGSISAASATSLTGTTGFGGTSAACPIAAGYFANTLLVARKALGDQAEGQRAGQVVATGRALATGPLDDGELTRRELWEVVLKSAFPTKNAGMTILPFAPPWTPAYFALQGYGVANADAVQRAKKVVLGDEPIPTRLDADAWFTADKLIQESLWGAWDETGDGVPDSRATVTPPQVPQPPEPPTPPSLPQLPPLPGAPPLPEP